MIVFQVALLHIHQVMILQNILKPAQNILDSKHQLKMSKFAKIQMWLSSQAVHGKVGSDEPWLSAVKYLHQEYAKTQSQIGPLEKYLHQEYVKTRYQIVSLSKKSAP